MYQIRTDLALETQEKMQEDKVELKGVRFSAEHVSKKSDHQHSCDRDGERCKSHGETQRYLYDDRGIEYG